VRSDGDRQHRQRGSSRGNDGSEPAARLVVTTEVRDSLVRVARHWLTVPCVIFVLAFLYRFNALGGALGGFDGDHFIYYLGATAVAHGERPLRDFADAGVMGAWPALTYELPAMAQRILGETFLTEALFTVSVLALALAISAATAGSIAGRGAAFAAVTAMLFASTKLYGYSKVLVFAVAAALFVRFVREPSRARAAQIGGWCAVAFLFRHDYLVYLVVPIIVLMIVGTPRWRDGIDRLAVCAFTVLVLLALPIYSIHHYVGLDSYVETARSLVAQEAERTTFHWPQFGPSPGGLGAFLSTEGNAIAFLYDLSVVIPIVALLALIGSPRAKGLDSRQTRAVIASLAVLALILDRFFLRNNLGARFGDLGAPVVILAAWLTWRFAEGSPLRRGVAWTAALIVFVLTVQAMDTTGSVWRELDTTGLSDSVRKIGRRVVAVTRDLGSLPPSGVVPPDAEPNVVEYVRLCTASTDRVLVVADSPEILALAGRGFAGGQPTFRPGFYRLESDQRETLERLRHESVPVVVLGDQQSYATHFVPQFRLIHDYVMATYERAGELPAPAGPPVQVFTRRGQHAPQQYRTTGLPCFAGVNG
jgi:hypothetical protein